MEDIDLEVIRGEDIADAGGPFDDGEPVWRVEIFFATDGEEFVGVGEAPGIEVCDGNAAVGIELKEDKGGAVDLNFVAAEGFAESAGEVCFSGAELAIKGDDESVGEAGGELIGEFLSIGFAVAVEAERVGHGPAVSGDVVGLSPAFEGPGVSGSGTLKNTSSRPDELL
jgi:hypothetical protein